MVWRPLVVAATGARSVSSVHPGRSREPGGARPPRCARTCSCHPAGAGNGRAHDGRHDARRAGEPAVSLVPAGPAVHRDAAHVMSPIAGVGGNSPSAAGTATASAPSRCHARRRRGAAQPPRRPAPVRAGPRLRHAGEQVTELAIIDGHDCSPETSWRTGPPSANSCARDAAARFRLRSVTLTRYSGITSSWAVSKPSSRFCGVGRIAAKTSCASRIRAGRVSRSACAGRPSRVLATRSPPAPAWPPGP